MNNRPYYHRIFTTSQKFYHKISILEQNSRNYESFLPRKFGAIRYVDGNLERSFVITYLRFTCIFPMEYNILIKEILRMKNFMDSQITTE